jgi:hypothetical protein
MVHLFGSFAPVKSGVAVGVGLAAFTVKKAKEKRTQARTARSDAPIRRNNCAPLETISNLFIKAFVNEQPVSYWRITSVNRNSLHYLRNTRESGQRESNPHGQLGRLELYH